jgi:hypothetical protein
VITDREKQKHIQAVFTAELQFRLASAVRDATISKVQPLDLPDVWFHGKHHVTYAEIALRQDQAEYAACFLHQSATFLMAVAIKDAICAFEPDPKNAKKSNVRAAYQIARLIRNAFAHAPFFPKWSIDADCSDKVFAIPGVIELATKGLHGTLLDWHHYGGPLALFRFCRFVRERILGDQVKRSRAVPLRQNVIVPIGDLILTKVGKAVKGRSLPDGGIDLGGGYVIRPAKTTGGRAKSVLRGTRNKSVQVKDLRFCRPPKRRT